MFGRGAEEVEALEAAGVPVEVVPGVSTLTALPGLAGIPLTARGIADQVTVSPARARRRRTRLRPARRGPGTLIIFMGLGTLEDIAADLIEAGRPAGEGAAVASRLSLPDYELRVGTLGTIAGLAGGLSAPALVIVGDVVPRQPFLAEPPGARVRRMTVPGQVLHMKNVGEFVDAFRQARLRRHRGLRRNRLRDTADRPPPRGRAARRRLEAYSRLIATSRLPSQQRRERAARRRVASASAIAVRRRLPPCAQVTCEPTIWCPSPGTSSITIGHVVLDPCPVACPPASARSRVTS